MNAEEKKKILFIEDDNGVATELMAFFKEQFPDLEFVPAVNTYEANQALKVPQFCAIITDNNFRRRSDESIRANEGLDILGRIRRGRYSCFGVPRDIPVLLQTSERTPELIAAEQAGSADVIDKKDYEGYKRFIEQCKSIALSPPAVGRTR